MLFSMFDTKNPEAGFPGAPALSEVDNPIFRQDAPSRYDYARVVSDRKHDRANALSGGVPRSWRPDDLLRASGDSAAPAGGLKRGRGRLPRMHAISAVSVRGTLGRWFGGDMEDPLEVRQDLMQEH